MNKGNVSVAVRKLAGTTSVIDIKGEVSSFAENFLMDAYSEASSGGAQNIILNFAELGYMNSSGIGLLVTLLIRVKRQGQRLMACGLNQHYRQIFELTRLNEAIHIFDTEEEALRSVETVGAS